MPGEQDQKTYELRMRIEADMYDLLDNGFTIDEVEDFVLGIVSDMKEDEAEDGEES